LRPSFLSRLDSNDMFIDEKLTRLVNLEQEFTVESSRSKKYELKSKVDTLLAEIMGDKFDFRYAFGKYKETDGFDIVIGNPPYVGEKGNKNIFEGVKHSKFGEKYYQGKMNLFYFFFHLALDVVKPCGSVSFITTNYYVTADGASLLRSDFKQRATVMHLINFNAAKVFESALGQHNMITFLRKNLDHCIAAKLSMVSSKLQNILKDSEIKKLLNGDPKYVTVSRKKQIELYDGDNNYIRAMSNDDPIVNILNKIKQSGYLLSDKFQVNCGIQSGADKVTNKHIQKYPDENYIKDSGIFVFDNGSDIYKNISENELKLIKPFYKNSDIKRYHSRSTTDLSILYMIANTDINSYQAIKKHLEQYKTLLSNRDEFLAQSKPWYLLHRARDQAIFTSPKIVAPQRSKSNTFGYNDVEWFAATDVFFITAPNLELNQAKYELKYVLALLNSKLYYHWFYHMGKRKGESLELIGAPLSETVIYDASNKQKDEIVSVVADILHITQQDDYLEKPEKQSLVKELQKKIDQLVYALYELTPEEIAIVEAI